MSCPPDTDEKRLARFYLYRKVKELWYATQAETKGTAIVLAGDEASEVGCLRYYLGLPRESVLFVDTDSLGLDQVGKLWPRVPTFHGEVSDAIASQDDICFLNLDFCGYMKNAARQAVEEACDRIGLYGVVAYTFRAARESANTPNWTLIDEMARRAIARDPRYRSLKEDSEDWLDTVRFVGYSQFLKQQLGARNFHTIFRMRYHSTCSMGVVALQNVPPHLRTPAWRREVSRYRSFEERVERIYSVDLRIKLRDLAMGLTDWRTSKQAAQILHLPPSTVGAWQAHKTRGTYRRQVEETEE